MDHNPAASASVERVPSRLTLRVPDRQAVVGMVAVASRQLARHIQDSNVPVWGQQALMVRPPAYPPAHHASHKRDRVSKRRECLELRLSKLKEAPKRFPFGGQLDRGQQALQGMNSHGRQLVVGMTLPSKTQVGGCAQHATAHGLISARLTRHV